MNPSPDGIRVTELRRAGETRQIAVAGCTRPTVH